MTILPLLMALVSGVAHAGEQVGTFTQVDGTVKLFTHPSTDGVKGPPPHARYDGVNYSAHDAKVGDRIERGNLVRTAPGSKARIVFPNGDHFSVGPGSSLRITWDADAAQARTEIKMEFGKLRGVVTPGGPRSKLSIRARSVVMGVRGTDFFVAENEKTGASEVAVLRGKVEVAPVTAPEKPVMVEAGFKGSFDKDQEAAPEVTRVSQSELKVIGEVSRVQTAIETEEARELEARATRAALEDVRRDDAKLYERLAGQEDLKSADDVNAAAVERLVATAPEVTSRPGAIVAKESEPEPGQQVADGALPARWLWLGLMAGTSSYQKDPSVSQGGSDSSSGHGFFAVESDFALGRRFGIVATASFGVRMETELDPGFLYQVDATQQARNIGVDVRMNIMAAALRYALPFTAAEKAGARFLLGPRLSWCSQAELAYSLSASEPPVARVDVTDQFKRVVGGVQFGAALFWRPIDRLRFMFDLRVDRGLTSVGRVTIPQDMDVRLGSALLGLSVAYGF